MTHQEITMNIICNEMEEYSTDIKIIMGVKEIHQLM